MEIIGENKTIKARKNHICNWCGGIINVGEKYESTTCKTDYIYRWKNHIKCGELVKALNMDGDDGVTRDDFYDYIWEAWRSFISDEVYEKDDFVEPTFKDKIEFVYNHIFKI